MKVILWGLLCILAFTSGTALLGVVTGLLLCACVPTGQITPTPEPDTISVG